MAAAPDVIVIGAGLVGTITALELAEAGVHVTLIEAGFPGGGSTGAAMGHIVAMDDSAEQLALCAHSRARWRQLAVSLPDSGEHDRCGTLWIAVTAAELAVAGERAAAYLANGIAAEVIDERGLYQLEPYLRPGLAGGLLVPDDAVCYPPAIARTLTERAARHGVTVKLRTHVQSLSPGGVRLADGSTLAAGAVVVAAGVASPLLVPELPIVPRKGHLVISDRRAGVVRHQLVELGYLQSAHTFAAASVAFNVQPRRTGQVLIGSSRELVGFDATINRELLGAMLGRATGFLPALRQMRTLRCWTGFRPATPDKLPLIGAWPELENIWIAAGHEGLGITMAPGTADIIVAGILGTMSAVNPEPFRPDRAMPALSAAA
ncbi:MAG: NAD(P)/FAD-dependent oxidoreductase [Gemmatimonadales bacterium]